MADSKVTYDELLEAGVHFGHLTRKWNPAMKPYIFMEKNGIHVIDLNKTMRMLEEACKVMKNMAMNGRKILFVATKKQAQEIVQRYATEMNMPYVTERWLGGMLTNFATVRKSIKKMTQIEKMKQDGTFETLNKKERLMLNREQAKLERVLKGISQLSRLPSAIFIIDIKREHIAVNEARKLRIPTLGLVDTNSNPKEIQYPVPGNDDATKSIELIMRTITETIKEGLEMRKKKKEDDRVKEEAERQEAAETAPAAEAEA